VNLGFIIILFGFSFAGSKTTQKKSVAISEAAQGGKGDDSASCSSGSSKRKCPDSLVTVPGAKPP
jgi:hypothetical protein